ncbi:MAG: hypothetical protein J5I81_04675 [Nitrococcus mobilis]|nr:hypothetical protein [Nitrococcus mobilis]
MRTTSILMATLVIALSQNAHAVTVLVDAAWVRAGFGSAGDRYLDKILLDLKSGDTFEIIMPALEGETAVRRLAAFTAPRRPSVRAAILTATRRLLNQVLTSVDLTDWPSLAQIFVQLAAAPDRDRHRAERYIIIGALTGADPPAIDLDLQRLLGARHITIVALAHPDTDDQDDSRFKAWRRFFAAAGVAQLELLHLPTSNKARMIDCSGRRLQVLDHQLK